MVKDNKIMIVIGLGIICALVYGIGYGRKNWQRNLAPTPQIDGWETHSYGQMAPYAYFDLPKEWFIGGCNREGDSIGSSLIGDGLNLVTTYMSVNLETSADAAKNFSVIANKDEYSRKNPNEIIVSHHVGTINGKQSVEIEWRKHISNGPTHGIYTIVLLNDRISFSLSADSSDVMDDKVFPPLKSIFEQAASTIRTGQHPLSNDSKATNC